MKQNSIVNDEYKFHDVHLPKIGEKEINKTVDHSIMREYLRLLESSGKTDETLRLGTRIGNKALEYIYIRPNGVSARIIEDTRNKIVGGVLLSPSNIIPKSWNKLKAFSDSESESVSKVNSVTLDTLNEKNVLYFSHEVPNDSENIEPLIALMKSFRFSSDIARSVYGIVTIESVEQELLGNGGFTKVQHEDGSYMHGLHRSERTYIRS